MVKAPGHRVLVKPREVMTKTASGIMLAVDEKLEKATTTIGTIVDVGPDAWKTMYINGDSSGPWAKVGDENWFPKYGGKWVTDEDTQIEYLVINDDDVLAVISK